MAPRIAVGHHHEVRQPDCIRAVTAEIILTFLFVFAGVGSSMAAGTYFLLTSLRVQQTVEINSLFNFPKESDGRRWDNNGADGGGAGARAGGGGDDIGRAAHLWRSSEPGGDAWPSRRRSHHAIPVTSLHLSSVDRICAGLLLTQILNWRLASSGSDCGNGVRQIQRAAAVAFGNGSRQLATTFKAVAAIREAIGSM
ncbi:putative aquaporin TIP4-3 [Dendrobium catenatum]|uniref:Putative aquaporin TIP4-3 n=1 Tax=Dendrobium catenatum TaxID=906689 RepID=A0A2I0VJP6_9ASPA|nr:putative aquaporin TIP4-3 [Dendrobium catenatum]